jgi:thiol:disulfide interchange protein DsbD
MYEIELPSGLARFTSAREGQGGFLGAIFMAVTFTITSFTCTGPFLGAMLAPVAGIRPPVHYLVLAALVYSTTFAAPFFVLALFPAMMKKLPKSGGWLNAIKVTMGFLELGAALKFLANTDLAWFPGNPRVFNYDTVLCAWIALSLACGLYLFGFFRLPHDDKVEHIGALRMVIGTIFLGLAFYMLPALYGGKPHGIIGENLIAFLPPRLTDGAERNGNGGGKDELAWHLDYIEGWKQAKSDNKLIFIDFTGITCTNCRDNEENVFPRPAVQEGLKNYVRVRLYTDSVPDRRLSASEAKEQAARNDRWKDAIADPTNPTYIVFDPDRNEPFTREGLLNGKVVGKRNGKIHDLADFVGFLKDSQRAGVVRSAPDEQRAGFAREREESEVARK